MLALMLIYMSDSFSLDTSVVMLSLMLMRILMVILS